MSQYAGMFSPPPDDYTHVLASAVQRVGWESDGSSVATKLLQTGQQLVYAETGQGVYFAVLDPSQRIFGGGVHRFYRSEGQTLETLCDMITGDPGFCCDMRKE